MPINEVLNCWVREFPSGDPVAKIAWECPFRMEQDTLNSASGTEHLCSHPDVHDLLERVRVDEVGHGSAGFGVDDYKTFCKAADRHLTSLGETSCLSIRGDFRIVQR